MRPFQSRLNDTAVDIESYNWNWSMAELIIYLFSILVEIQRFRIDYCNIILRQFPNFVLVVALVLVDVHLKIKKTSNRFNFQDFEKGNSIKPRSYLQFRIRRGEAMKFCFSAFKLKVLLFFQQMNSRFSNWYMLKKQWFWSVSEKFITAHYFSAEFFWFIQKIIAIISAEFDY